MQLGRREYALTGQERSELSRSSEAGGARGPAKCGTRFDTQAPLEPAQSRAWEPVHTRQPLAGCAPGPSIAALCPPEPRRAAGIPRHAPHLSLTALSRRSAPASEGQFRSAGTGAAPLRKGLPRRHDTRASRAQPAPGASVLRAGAAARAPPKPVHTHQPLTGVYTRPASRRLTPRRSQNSRTEPQAHPGTRRTFHQPRGPPGTEAERAGSVLNAGSEPASSWPRHHRSNYKGMYVRVPLVATACHAGLRLPTERFRT